MLNISVSENDASFVPFLALLHIGTATALLIIYRVEWWHIVRGFVRSAITGRIANTDERLAMLLVVGTIPTGIAGFLLDKPLKKLFAYPQLAALFLIVNGGILFAAELLRRRDERRRSLTNNDRVAEERAYGSINDLGFRGAILVGACQMLALLPGISRSGVTMAAGLVAGLRHGEALHFAFLLATPIILAAGLLEVPTLVGNGSLGLYLLGAFVAGAAAYASARFLVRYFRVGRLDPYAGYCAALGITALLVVH